jgi:multiple sugar transport system substrate-binding protein
MRKRVALLGAAACISAALTSVGAPTAFASSGKVTLTYWAGFTGGDEPTYVALVKKFNQTHPDIHVDMTIEPWDTIAHLPHRRVVG